MVDDGERDDTNIQHPTPGLSSTRSVSAVLEADLRQSFEATNEGHRETEALHSPTLVALTDALRENQSALADLASRTAAELDRDTEPETVDEVLTALLEVGLRTVAPQYAVVVEDARQAANPDIDS